MLKCSPQTRKLIESNIRVLAFLFTAVIENLIQIQ